MIHLAAVAHYLAGLGLVTFDAAGADCFLETFPAAPVDAVVVRNLPLGGDDFETWGMVGVQVAVRADGSGGTAREPYERCAAIRDRLHGLRHVTLQQGLVDELRVVWCRAETRTPIRLSRDEEQHLTYSVGYRLMVNLSTMHSID